MSTRYAGERLALAAFLAILTCSSMLSAGEDPAAADGADGRPEDVRMEAELRRLMLEKGQRQAEAQRLVTLAEKRMELSEYAEARRLLEEALDLDPLNDAARARLEEVKALVPSRPDKEASTIAREQIQARLRQQAEAAEINALLSAASRKAEEAAAEAEADGAVGLEKALVDLRSAGEDLDRAWLKIRALSGRVALDEQRARGVELRKRVREMRRELTARQDALSRQSAMEQAEEERQQQASYEQERQGRLLERVREHMRMHQWDEAESILELVLREEPNLEEALTLRRRLRDERLSVERAKVADEHEFERRQLLQYIEEAATPEIERLSYPSNWHELARQREQRQGGPDEGELPDWKREILRKLEEPVTFEFDNEEITEVIRFLDNYTGVDIIPGKALQPGAAGGAAGGAGGFDGGGFDGGGFDGGFGDGGGGFGAGGGGGGGGGGGTTRRVTLRLENVSLRNALEWITTITDLTYRIQDEAIIIDEAGALDNAENRARIYDISDLMIEIGDSPMPSGGLGGAGGGGGAGGEEIGLLDLLRRLVPGTEESESQGISIYSNNLVVRGPDALQSRVRQALERLRAAQAIQVSVASRFLSVRDETMEVFNSEVGDFSNTWTDNPNEFRGVPGDGGSVYNPAQHGPRHTDVRGFYNNQQTFAPLVSLLGAAPGTAISGQSGLSGAIFQQGWLGNIEANWFVKMLREQEYADELWAPHLLTYNNRRAYVAVGDEQAYTQSYEVADEGGGYQTNTETLETGVVLLVRPTVSADKRYISLDIRTRINKVLEIDTAIIELDEYQSPNDDDDDDDDDDDFYYDWGYEGRLIIDLPTTLVQETQTYATLPDGGTILLSGMGVNVNGRQMAGLPIASDLPILGKLFSSRRIQDEKRNLMILVNARMLLLEEEEARLVR